MKELIINKITASETGSISYSDYIELALYHETNGYYMKEKSKIGKTGDFYTSSNVHHVFGKVLSMILIDLVKAGKLPPKICEIGAGTGRLAHSILTEWEQRDNETFQSLNYYIVEMSPYHLSEQPTTIEHIDKVSQFQSLEEMTAKLGPYRGFVLSNELFDAFPVDVVQKREGTIYEVRVGVDADDQLMETLIPCENIEILDWLTKYQLSLEEGQRIEIPIAMKKWIEKTSNWLEQGIVFTFDYGYTNEEWMEPVHREGSLRGYYKHEMITDTLEHPGDMDLTTHIHLDAVKTIGEEVGLVFIDMIKQHKFLLHGGILTYLQDTYDPNPFSEISKQNRAIRTLLADDGISSSFTVILQQKGLEGLSIHDILTYKQPFE